MADGSQRSGYPHRAMSDDRLVIDLDTPLPPQVNVGEGVAMFVSGSCFSLGADVRRLALLVDEEANEVIGRAMPRSDRWRQYGSGAAYRSGFWALVSLQGGQGPCTVDLSLRATLADGQVLTHRLGQIALIAGASPVGDESIRWEGGGSRVAICMATYEPPAGFLERQLASLRAQTHADWVCLISDDHSSQSRFERLLSLTADDPRFIISRSPQRLGFYRNFERALRMVPAGVEYVALCDQDDRWHPDKLEQLLGAIGAALLVYSDMRVVNETGKVISETFWSQRRNNHTNLSSMLIANTVTGAASLFRRQVIDRAMPFPPVHGRSPHDQWLACVALASGEIAYVDRCLQDYVQHPSTVFGHPAAHPQRSRQRHSVTARIRRVARRGRPNYFWELCRIALAARTLELRCGDALDRRKRRAVARASRLGTSREPVLWLLSRSLRRLVGLNETLRHELVLLEAVAWRRLATAIVRLRPRPGGLFSRSDPFLGEGAEGEPKLQDSTHYTRGSFGP